MGGGVVGGFGGAGAGMGAASSAAPQFLTVWDLAARKKLRQFPGCQTAALAPGGQALGMVGRFGKKWAARLVDETTGSVLKEIDLGERMAQGLGFVPPPVQVNFAGPVSFVPDGSRMLIPPGREYLAWDLKRNRLSRTLDSPAQNIVGLLPDGKSLVAIGYPNEFVPPGGAGDLGGPGAAVRVRAWDIASGKFRPLLGDRFTDDGILSPDGKLLATFARSNEVSMMGVAGTPPPDFGGFGDPVPGLPGPARERTARIRLWDLKTGKVRVRCDTLVAPAPIQQKIGPNGIIAMPGGIQGAAFSPDGRMLATCTGAGQQGHLQLFDTRTGRELLHARLKFCPQAVAFSGDGSLVATAGAVGPLEVRVWQLPSAGDLSTPIALEPAQLAALWRSLASDKLGEGLRAERVLAGASAKLVLPLFKEHLKPVTTSTNEARQIAKWVADLSSDQFRLREKATEALVRAGPAAATALRLALEERRSLEFRRRAQQILARLGPSPALTPDQRRQQRAIAVIEVQGTADARQLLNQLASGVPEAWLTQEARTAKERLDSK
jgi:hypothetical protein